MNSTLEILQNRPLTIKQGINDEEYPNNLDRDENLAQIEIATLGILFITTVLGNLTVLLAMWIRKRYCGRKKLSRMYFFILHLTIADLMVAFFSILPQLAWEITYRFQGGFILCKLVKYGQTLGPYLSSYILMATALDRHQAICYPLTYCSWTSRRSKFMIYLAWIASLLCCIPQVFIFSYQSVGGEENNIHDCWATFSEDWGEQTYVIWYSISIFLIPLLVLIYTYTRICKEIWRCSELAVRPQSFGSFGKSSKRSIKIPLISRAKINTVKQTVAVILMYILCSTPFIVAQLWATIDPTSSFLEGSTFTILTLLYSLNSCVNPWIYLLFNKELRKMLIKQLFSTTIINKQNNNRSEVHTENNSSVEQVSLKLTRASSNNRKIMLQKKLLVTST